MNIIQAITDPRIFKPLFKDPNTWSSWFTFLRVFFGLKPNPKNNDLEVYQQATKRIEWPQKAFDEVWLICGRRGGKSFVTSIIGTYLACFCDYSEYLVAGERGKVMLIAVDKQQAKVLKRYISGIFDAIPLLQEMILRETTESVELKNNIDIEIHTCNYRSVRGYTNVATVCEEIAFWRSEESSSPDFEVLDAVRPAMGTIPNSKLICLSSPYARKGALYDAYEKYYGKEDKGVLIWQAETRIMNPTFQEYIIRRAKERDPVVAASEYGAEFRKDVEQYCSREALERCIVKERTSLVPYWKGVKWDRNKVPRYTGFTDPSGGVRDSFTLAIGHKANNKYILDFVTEKIPPFSPDAVVKEYTEILKNYRVSTVIGDRYAGEWPREAFRQNGIQYEVSDRSKSQLYIDFLPMINSPGEIELLDNAKMKAQFLNLERKSKTGGKDSIDKGPGCHDDIANVVAGVMAVGRKRKQAGVW